MKVLLKCVNIILRCIHNGYCHNVIKDTTTTFVSKYDCQYLHLQIQPRMRCSRILTARLVQRLQKHKKDRKLHYWFICLKLKYPHAIIICLVCVLVDIIVSVICHLDLVMSTIIQIYRDFKFCVVV